MTLSLVLQQILVELLIFQARRTQKVYYLYCSWIDSLNKLTYQLFLTIVPDAAIFGGDEDEDVSQFETVVIAEWKNRPDLLASFGCTEIKMNGQTYER